MEDFTQKMEQLQMEEAVVIQKISQEQHKRQRLENRKSYYETGERKRRNHRLITRGAAVESLVPEVKGMGEQEFYALMETILTRPEIVSLIRAAVQPKGGD